MRCNTCQGTGFLNLDQVDPSIVAIFDQTGEHRIILDWMKEETQPHDVKVCDCCGNGDNWYNVPGEHFTGEDKSVYAYNNFVPECN